MEVLYMCGVSEFM